MHGVVELVNETVNESKTEHAYSIYSNLIGREVLFKCL